MAEELKAYIFRELDRVQLDHNCFSEEAMELILRSSEGLLRRCRNLCVSAMLEDGNALLVGEPGNVIVKENYWIRTDTGESGNAIDFFVNLGNGANGHTGFRRVAGALQGPDRRLKPIAKVSRALVRAVNGSSHSPHPTTFFNSPSPSATISPTPAPANIPDNTATDPGYAEPMGQFRIRRRTLGYKFTYFEIAKIDILTIFWV